MSGKTMLLAFVSMAVGAVGALVLGFMAWGLFGFAPYHDPGAVAGALGIIFLVGAMGATYPGFHE